MVFGEPEHTNIFSADPTKGEARRLLKLIIFILRCNIPNKNGVGSLRLPLQGGHESLTIVISGYESAPLNDFRHDQPKIGRFLCSGKTHQKRGPSGWAPTSHSRTRKSLYFAHQEFLSGNVKSNPRASKSSWSSARCAET